MLMILLRLGTPKSLSLKRSADQIKPSYTNFTRTGSFLVTIHQNRRVNFLYLYNLNLLFSNKTVDLDSKRKRFLGNYMIIRNLVVSAVANGIVFFFGFAAGANHL